MTSDTTITATTNKITSRSAGNLADIVSLSRVNVPV